MMDQIPIGVWASLNPDPDLGWTNHQSVQIGIWALTYMYISKIIIERDSFCIGGIKDIIHELSAGAMAVVLKARS